MPRHSCQVKGLKPSLVLHLTFHLNTPLDTPLDRQIHTSMYSAIQKLEASDPRDLKIELAAPPHWTFAPGDTVIGTIVRKSHLVSPKATLDLWLNGYTQTQILEFVGSYGSNYENKARNHEGTLNFFPSWKPEVLWNKAIHISKDDDDFWSVPFSVTIPTQPEYAGARRHKPEVSFLPIDEESFATQTLPGSFESSKSVYMTHKANQRSTSTNTCDGSIVYRLQARLRYTHGGLQESTRAFCPISLRHPQRPPDYNSERLISKRSLPVTIQSHRLNPALRDKSVHLSFSQKTQQFFGSSRVPHYTYRAEFGLPRSLFLSEAAGTTKGSPFALTLAIIPDPGPNMTSDTLKGVTQTFQVLTVRVSLDSITYVRAGGIGSKIRTAKNVYPHNVSISMLSQSQSGPIDLIASTEKPTSAVELGTLIGLTLGPRGLRINGACTPFDREDLYPDFVSYLIKHSHTLSCEVEIRLAEETKWVRTSVPIVVN